MTYIVKIFIVLRIVLMSKKIIHDLIRGSLRIDQHISDQISNPKVEFRLKARNKRLFSEL